MGQNMQVVYIFLNGLTTEVVVPAFDVVHGTVLKNFNSKLYYRNKLDQWFEEIQPFAWRPTKL